MNLKRLTDNQLKVDHDNKAHGYVKGRAAAAKGVNEADLLSTEEDENIREGIRSAYKEHLHNTFSGDKTEMHTALQDTPAAGGDEMGGGMGGPMPAGDMDMGEPIGDEGMDFGDLEDEAPASPGTEEAPVGDSKRTLYDSRLLGWFFSNRYPVTDAVNKRTRELITNWATKAGQSPEDILAFADQWDSPAEQQYAAKWFLGNPELTKDQVDYAFRICRSKKIDPSKSNPQDLISKYGSEVAEKKSKSGYSPEDVFGKPVKDFGNGTVAYLAEGKQQECRDAINRFFGPQANPWCLLKGDGKGNLTEDASSYWSQYSAYPKWIIFHNGQLLAFSAGNDEDYREYWDRFDRSFTFPPVPGTTWENSGYKYSLQKDGTIEWERDGKQGYIDWCYSSSTISQNHKIDASRHKQYAPINGNVVALAYGLYKENVDGRYKIINSEGQPITDQLFDEVTMSLADGIFRVQSNGKWNFLKTDGTYLSDDWFDNVDRFYFDLARVQLNSKWNFIKPDGTYLSDQWFDDIYRFNEGFAEVKIKRKMNFLTTNGSLLSDQWFDWVGDFYEGFAEVKIKRKMNFLTTNGSLLSDQWFDAVYDFEDGLAKVMLNRKMNFLSTNGSLLSDQWFDWVGDFNEGFAEVKLKRKMNFLSTNGSLLSDQWFDEVYKFENGVTEVELNGKWHRINTKGQIVDSYTANVARLKSIIRDSSYKIKDANDDGINRTSDYLGSEDGIDISLEALLPSSVFFDIAEQGGVTIEYNERTCPSLDKVESYLRDNWNAVLGDGQNQFEAPEMECTPNPEDNTLSIHVI